MKSELRKPTQIRYYFEVRLVDIPKNHQNRTLRPVGDVMFPQNSRFRYHQQSMKEQEHDFWSVGVVSCVWTFKINPLGEPKKFMLKLWVLNTSLTRRLVHLQNKTDAFKGGLETDRTETCLERLKNDHFSYVVHLPLSQTTVFQGVLYFHLLFHCETATNTIYDYRLN